LLMQKNCNKIINFLRICLHEAPHAGSIDEIFSSSRAACTKIVTFRWQKRGD
jgi:hypothetical protein